MSTEYNAVKCRRQKHLEIVMRRIITAIKILFLIQLISGGGWSLEHSSCFALSLSPSLPVMGIGSLLFRPRKLIIRPTKGDDGDLVDSAVFFTDAFWNGKIGGVKELNASQLKKLSNQQIAEFRRRYSTTSNAMFANKDRRSELIICQNSKTGEILGCAGIEVSRVETPNGKFVPDLAPLMSNVAVSRKYRRLGIAVDLVKGVENVIRREWGMPDCYLFVEKRNVAAVKLYKKMGYRVEWMDDTATTLIPKKNGSMSTSPTTLICMKKTLVRGGGLLDGLIGRIISG